MYEFFDHTADVGLRVRAAELSALFEDAAAGLFAIIVDAPLGEVTLEREFRISGTRHDYLLFDWLNELLYVFDTERIVFGQFAVEFTPDGIRAKAGGAPADSARQLLHEVKAITYHALKVEHTGEGWLAELIVDI